MKNKCEEKKAERGSWRWLNQFQFDRENDSPSDARNILLVVAALITAVTFQAGVNPPGGVWNETNGTHTAGQAIYASQKPAFYVFLLSNTLALSSAIMIIMSLTHRFPLQFEVWFSTIAMIVTYTSSIVAVTPKYVHFRFLLIAAAGPFLARLLWELAIRIRGQTGSNPNNNSNPNSSVEALPTVDRA